MKILYIEDSEDNIHTIQRIARHLGHELLVATTGKAGYAMLAKQPDLVLIDINLPDANGLDLAKQIHQEHPTLPLVALTADTYRYDEAQALEAGCRLFIPKPFTVETIVDLFTRFSSQRAASG